MQYDLLKYTGLQPNDKMPSMSLFYSYSKMAKDIEKKEQEKIANANANKRKRNR